MGHSWQQALTEERPAPPPGSYSLSRSGRGRWPAAGQASQRLVHQQPFLPGDVVGLRMGQAACCPRLSQDLRAQMPSPQHHPAGPAAPGRAGPAGSACVRGHCHTGPHATCSWAWFCFWFVLAQDAPHRNPKEQWDRSSSSTEPPSHGVHGHQAGVWGAQLTAGRPHTGQCCLPMAGHACTGKPSCHCPHAKKEDTDEAAS